MKKEISSPKFGNHKVRARGVKQNKFLPTQTNMSLSLSLKPKEVEEEEEEEEEETVRRRDVT